MSTQQTMQLNDSLKQWIYVMHLLFEEPSLVLIGGEWKQGKTDFSLYISEWLRRIKSWTPGPYSIPIVSEIASNIFTFDHYPQISDLVSLKQWMYGSPNRKLFILDEGNKHLSNRRIMSGKSVGFLELVPEVSKGRCRLIVIGHHLDKLDPELLEDIWVRGIFQKHERKIAELIYPEEFEFADLPPTSIKFDPWALAPFTEKPVQNVYFKDGDTQKVWEWANGASYKSLRMHPMELNRIVRKYCKANLENQFTPHTN